MKRALGCMNFMTRRELLCSAGAATAYAAMPRSLKGQSTAAVKGQTQSRLVNDPMRPQFHLLPAKNLGKACAARQNSVDMSARFLRYCSVRAVPIGLHKRLLKNKRERRIELK